MRHDTLPNLETIKAMESLLKVSGDATRLKIMFSLIDDTKCECLCDTCGHCEHRCCMVEKNVSEIMEATGASQSLVSHQLKTLKDAGLVSIRREGTKVYYSLSDGHIKALLKVVQEHVLEE